MNARLGRAETSGEVLNFSSSEKVVEIGELRTEWGMWNFVTFSLSTIDKRWTLLL